MRRVGFILLLLPCMVQASEVAHTSPEGKDSVKAQFFRDYYHRSDLVYYLEALDDHTIVETTTYGQWWEAERLTLAVEGLPYYANRYYVDGMRVDDRFQAGSTHYVPNMQRYDMSLNTHTGQFYFAQDTAATDYVEATYNFGQVGNGEPAAGTAAVYHGINQHISAMESAEKYKHINARRHLAGAGKVDAAYTFRDKQGNGYRQHLLAQYGQRLITKENQCGLIDSDPLYSAPYYKVQADGYLPIRPTEAVAAVGYRLNFSGRTDMGSEQFMNYNEVYDWKNYSGTIYLKRDYLTTGITWNSDVTHHDNLSFRKNIIDQDGESFAPWVADGQTHTLSWAVNYEQPVLKWLSVHVDAYNSFVYFSPEQTSFSNTVYLQSPVDDQPRDVYRYEWTSKAFSGGLLENTIGLSAHYATCKVLDLNAHLDFTLDGIVLANKTKVSPNWQAGINLDLHPCKWFEMGLTVSHERLPYTMDQLRFFSDDYMNANIYYAGTDNLFSTTGGAYHHYGSGLRQTSYLELDLPIHFRFGGGKHEIILQQSYKKYFHVWYTYYQGNLADIGYYQDQVNPMKPEQTLSVFYENAGVKQYEVGYTEPFGGNGFVNSPYYFSQLTRYTYTGNKVLFSLSWQSMLAAGYAGLGNGATSNTIGILTESTANPNTTNVVKNPNSTYKGVSRMDLDKGFVLRLYLGYNICKWVQAGLTFKWTDGKPFTSYQYYEADKQVAVLPLSSRGINPTDNNFGTRNCSKYNIDLHVQGAWDVKNVPMRLKVECYNIWDFCHDLAEMSFFQDIPQANRSSVILDIPTGILATFTIDLPRL